MRTLLLFLSISIAQAMFAQKDIEVFGDRLSAEEVLSRLCMEGLDSSNDGSGFKLRGPFHNYKKGEVITVEDSIFRKYAGIDILLYILKVKDPKCDSCSMKLSVVEMVRSQYSAKWILSSIIDVREHEYFDAYHETTDYNLLDYWGPGYLLSITFRFENGHDRVIDYTCLYLNGKRVFQSTSQYHRIEFDEKSFGYTDAVQFSSSFSLDQQKKQLRLHTKGSKYYSEKYKKVMPVDKIEYFSLQLNKQKEFEFLPVSKSTGK